MTEPMVRQLYLANIPFENVTGEKYRPALVVRSDATTTTVYKITSQYAHKSLAIKAVYFPIHDWQSAGLDEPSYVDVHRVFTLPRTFFEQDRFLGTLSQTDTVRLARFIRTQQAAIKLVVGLSAHTQAAPTD